MATKLSPNVRWFDNRHILAEKIDDLVANVSKRGVFVVKKNNDLGNYEIVDYVNKNPVIIDLPTRNIANRICSSYNKGNRISDYHTKNKFRDVIDRIYKLKMDCMFYNRTITTSADDFKVHVAEVRKDIAVIQLKQLYKDLNRFL